MSEAYKTVITVPDVDTKLTLGFTTVEVWASTNRGATYREITASSPTPATVYSKAPSTLFRAGGTAVGFLDNNIDLYLVSFPESATHWTATQIVDRINEVAPGFATSDANGVVALRSSTEGRVSSLEILYCSCADLWSAGQAAVGGDTRIALQTGVYIYPFVDLAGIADIRYKWRFSNNGGNPVSLFSERVLGQLEQSSGVPVAIAVARFVGLDGSFARRTVLISSCGYPQAIAGTTVGNELTLIVHSDDKGFLQVPLVKGAFVRVSIEGTAFIKEFQVPSTDTFDLLQAMASAPDLFTVQTIPPLLTRRNI